MEKIMALLLRLVHLVGGTGSMAMLLHFHTYFLSRFQKCLLRELSLILVLWMLLLSCNGKSDLIICFLLPVTPSYYTSHSRLYDDSLTCKVI